MTSLFSGSDMVGAAARKKGKGRSTRSEQYDPNKKRTTGRKGRQIPLRSPLMY